MTAKEKWERLTGPEIQMMNTELVKDTRCGKPNLLPGDILETKGGDLVVITEAKTIINGGKYEWNDEFPSQDEIEHGWPPCYAVNYLPGYEGEKIAWWQASEFKRIVALGPLHRIFNV